MKFLLQKNGTALFEEIDPFLAALLLLPFQKKEEDRSIMIAPFFAALPPQEASLKVDWEDYIVPELKSLLEDCHTTVLGDLEGMKVTQKPFSRGFFQLQIPMAHRASWLRMMSVVRLKIAQEYDFKEEASEEMPAPPVTTVRGQAFLQMQLFALIQQSLIEAEDEIESF